MTTNDLIKRMIDAGLQFTQMTQARAEEIARDLQESGAVRFDEVQSTVSELMERGRDNTEQLLGLIQREVSKQLANFGVDVKDLEARVEELHQRVTRAWPSKGRPATSTAAKAAPAPSASASATSKRSTAKKSATKKTTAKKAAAKRSTAKKATAKKATAKKATAKKSPAKRSTTKKRAAKKTAAKKSSSG